MSKLTSVGRGLYSAINFNRTPAWRVVIALAVAAAALLASHPALAAVATWNTAGTTVTWSPAGNWTGGTPTGNSIVFGGDNPAGTTASDVLNNDLATAASITGITFNAGAPAYTFNGSSITLAGNITNNSTNSDTINLNVITTAVRTVVAMSGSNVTLGGNISGASGGIITTGNAGTVTLSGANSYTGLTTSAAGTLILSGTNSSSGGTTLTGGTLQLANTTANNGGLASGLLTLSGGTLQAGISGISLSNATTIPNASTNTVSVTISGANALTLGGNFTNNQSNTGASILNSSIVPFAGNALTLSGNVYLAGDNTARTLTIAGIGTTTISGVIANNASGNTVASNLTYAATGPQGTLNLNNGTNSYTGTTTLTAGTLVLGNATALPAASTLSLGGGTLQSTVANLSIPNTTTLAASSTISGANAITFSGNFTQSASSTLTSSITGGTGLTLGNVYLANSSTARTLTIAGSGTTTISGVIANDSSNASVSGLTLNAAGGTLYLGGANTYTGTTTVNAGTLQLNETATTTVLNTTSLLTMGGGTLNVQATDAGGAFTQTVGAFALTAATSSGITLVKAGSTTGTNLTTTGALTAPTITSGTVLCLNLTNAGDGILTLGSTAAATFSPWAVVTTSSTSSGFGAINDLNQLVRYTSGTALDATSNDNTINYTTDPFADTGANKYSGTPAVLTMNAGTGALNSLFINANAAGTLDLGTYGVTMALTQNALGMAGSSNYAISGGNLTAANINTLLTVTNVGPGTLTISSLINATGTGGLAKAGSGTLLLSAANTYTGATTVEGGTLQVGNATALGLNTGASGTSSAALKVVTGATLDLYGNSIGVGSLNGGGTITSSQSGALTLTVNGNAASAFSGLIQNGSATSLGIVVGSGIVNTTFSNNANTYSGGTTVNFDGGTVVSGASSLVGPTLSNAGTILSSGSIVSGPFGTGTLTFNNGSTLSSRSTSGLMLANTVNTNGNVCFNGTGASYALYFDQTGLTAPGGFVLTGNTMLVNGVAAMAIRPQITSSPSGSSLTLAAYGQSSGFTLSGGIAGSVGNVSFNQHTAGGVTVSGPVNNTGTISQNGGAGAWNTTSTISGAIGGNVTGIVQNSFGALLSLTGVNTSLTAPITINAGFLSATSASNNALQSLGSGAITLNGGQLLVYSNGVSANQTIITGNGTTTGNAVTVSSNGSLANPAAIGVGGATATGSTFVFNTLNMAASNAAATQPLYIWGAYSDSVKFAGATTLGANALFMLAQRYSYNPTAPNLTLAAPVADGGSGYGVAVSGPTGGTLILSSANTYTGPTTVYTGTLQADDNAGLPGLSSTGGGSNLVLNGGVLQNSTATTFTRALGTGQGQVQFGAAGGGFAASTALAVNLGGASATLAWGSTASFLPSGAPLLLNSTSVTFQNGLDLNTGNQIVTAAGTATISGAITDPTTGGTFTKNGAGTLTLSNANTYAGATNVNAGILKIDGATGSLNSASNLTLGSAATETVGSGQPTTNLGVSPTFNYDNTTSAGARTPALGTLTFNIGDGTVQSTRTAAQDVTLTFSSLATRAAGATGNFNASGGTNGTNNSIVLQNGSGGGRAAGFIDPGVFFAGGSTSVGYAYYTGTYVRALIYGTDTNAPAAVTGAQATLGTDDSTKNVEYQGGAAATSTTNGSTASGATTMVVTDGTKFAVGQAITASVAGLPVNTYVTAISTNTLTLSAATTATIATGTTITPYNYVTGQTTASLNTLNLNGTGSGLTLGASQVLTVSGILRSGNNGTMNIIAGGAGSGIQAASNADLVIRNDLANDALMISTQILANGANNLVKSGLGTLTLSPAASNTYTGTTYVNAGTLTLAGTTSGVIVIPGNVVINGGTLGITQTNTTWAGEIASTATVTLNAGAYNQYGTQQTLAGYTQYGGTTNFNANAANRNDQMYVHNALYNAQTTLNGGTFKAHDSNYGSSWTTDGITIGGGNNMFMGNGANGGTSNGNIPLNIGPAGLTINQPAGGPFTALTLAGTNNNSANVGVIVLGGPFTYNANVNNSNPAIIAATSQTGNSSISYIALTGTTTFTIGHNANATQDMVIQPYLTNWGGNASATINTAAGTGGVIKTGPGVLAVAGNNTYTGITTINQGVLSVPTLSNASVMDITTTINSQFVTVLSTAGLSPGMKLFNTSSGTNNTYIMAVDSGTSLWISNVATSATTVSTTFAAPNGLGLSSNAAANLVLDGGTLQYTGPTTSTDRLFTLRTGGGGLDASGSGPVTFSNTGSAVIDGGGSRTLTLSGSNTGANTLAPVIGDETNTVSATSLTKSGVGTWLLTGANPYSGATAVNGGTLRVTGSIAGTIGVAVVPSAVLDLASVGGTALAASGTYTPVTNDGTMNVSSLSEKAGAISGSGSTSVLDSASLTADSIVQGTLSIGAGGIVTIRETTGGNASTVPEPGTWVLIGTALMGWLVFRRRFRG